jgi:molybdopterin converting factor small subunit
MPPAPNREYVSADSALADDDEVVLLPPRRMRKN